MTCIALLGVVLGLARFSFLLAFIVGPPTIGFAIAGLQTRSLLGAIHGLAAALFWLPPLGMVTAIFGLGMLALVEGIAGSDAWSAINAPQTLPIAFACLSSAGSGIVGGLTGARLAKEGRGRHVSGQE